MVEIIKRGTPPGEKEYTATCSTCKTQFRFKQCEAERVSDMREGDYLSIRCPLEGCGHQVTHAISHYNGGYDPYDR